MVLFPITMPASSPKPFLAAGNVPWPPCPKISGYHGIETETVNSSPCSLKKDHGLDFHPLFSCRTSLTPDSSVSSMIIVLAVLARSVPDPECSQTCSTAAPTIAAVSGNREEPVSRVQTSPGTKVDNGKWALA